MKKILLVLLIGFTITLSGCTIQDYKDYREEFITECKADVECKQMIIDDADDLIKNTPTYIALEDNMLTAQDDILVVQNELDIAELTIDNLELQVEINADDITELDTRIQDIEYRTNMLEAIVNGNSLTNVYQKALNVHNLVTVNKIDVDDVKIYIHLQQAIDNGYDKQEIKQSLKAYLWEDLQNIIDKDKVTIYIYADGSEDIVINLEDLIPVVE